MKRLATSGVACAAFAASLFLTAEARAQDRAADAERLFREAQQLLEGRDYANACPKLERAYALDKKLGTLINLAFCHKAQETYWLAWLEFRQAEVMAIAQNRLDRRDFVRQQLSEIEKKGKLALVVIDNPRNEPLTEVLVEDRRVPEAENGAVFMAEPTTSVDRKVTFRAKGKKSVEKLVKIARSDKTVQHVVVPPMEDQPPEAPPAAPVVTETPSPKPAAPARDEGASSDDGSTRRLIGWSVAGLGVASIGVGSYFGIETFRSPCAGSSKNPPCTSEVKAEADRNGLVATVTMIGGAAAVVGGLYLVLTSSSSPRVGRRAVEPVLGATYAGVRGVF